MNRNCTKETGEPSYGHDLIWFESTPKHHFRSFSGPCSIFQAGESLTAGNRCSATCSRQQQKSAAEGMATRVREPWIASLGSIHESSCISKGYNLLIMRVEDAVQATGNINSRRRVIPPGESGIVLCSSPFGRQHNYMRAMIFIYTKHRSRIRFAAYVIPVTHLVPSTSAGTDVLNFSMAGH